MDGEEDFRKLLLEIDSNINKINKKCKNKDISKVRKDYTKLKNIIEGYIGKSGGGNKKTQRNNKVNSKKSIKRKKT